MELTDSLGALDISLLLLELLEGGVSLPLLLLLLLFGKLELLVAHLPELSVLGVFLPLGILLGLLALDLQLTRSLNGSLHLGLALLLLLVETVGAILSLSNLTVQNFLLVVPQGLKFLDLAVDHSLFGLLFCFEALLFSLLLESLKLFTLSGELFNLLFILDLL